jgi:uncharacterized RDD family membrane protein YckC
VTDLVDIEAPSESSATESASEIPAFGDWREQLRERVKEIRARKLATRREGDPELNLEPIASAATAEKLEAARAQASEASSESASEAKVPASVEAPLEEVYPEAIEQSVDEHPVQLEEVEPEAETGEQPVDEAHVQLEEAQPEPADEPTDEHPVQLVDGERSARRSEIAGIVDDLLGPETEPEGPNTAEANDDFSADEVTMLLEPADDDIADESHSEAPAQAAETDTDAERAFMSAPAAQPADTTEPAAVSEPEQTPEQDLEDVEMPDAVPLFQNDPQIYADDPLLEVEVDLAGTEIDDPAASEPSFDSEDESADSPETEAAPTPSASVLDQIPPELRDVDIPAWALPREPSRLDPGPDADAATEEAATDDAEDVAFLAEPEAPEDVALPTEPDAAEEPAFLAETDADAAFLTAQEAAEETPDAIFAIGDAEAAAEATDDALDAVDEEIDAALEAAVEDGDTVLDIDSDADETGDEDDIDTYLVGEYTSVTKKRIDLGPPPDTPVRTEDLLDRPIGELAGLTEEDEITIAPPGGLVDPESIQAFEVTEDVKSEPSRQSLPGLFDEPEDAAPLFSWTAPGAEESSVTADALSTDSSDEEVEPEAEQEPEEDRIDVLLARKVEAERRAAEAEVKAAAEVARAAAVILEPSAAAPKLDIKPAAAAPNLDIEPEAATPDLDLKAGAVDADLDLDSLEPARELDLDAVLRAPADESAPDADDAADEDVALEWDAEPDPELVADARAQHADPVAPVSDRVFSAVADGLVLLTMGLLLVIAGASAAGTAVVPFVQAAPIPFVATWLVFSVVYAVMFNGTCGQTLGKMAMRVRVIGNESFHVGYGTAALRALAYGVAAIPAGLGLIPALRDPQHRGLHDRLTGTRVVKA